MTIYDRDITENELLLLQIIYKLRIAKARELAWLSGNTDFTYCRKRLRKLVLNGYLETYTDTDRRLCYTLTSAGLRKIGKINSRPYEITFTSRHALVVGVVCAYLHIRDGTHVLDMMTDIDLISSREKHRHRPDIVVNGVAYEIELNHKPERLWKTSLIENAREYSRQCWVTPDRFPSIGRNLERAAQGVGVPIAVFPLSAVEDAIRNGCIHQNRLGTRCEAASTVSPVGGSTVLDKYGQFLRGGGKLL